MALLKRQSFIRETGLKDEASYQEYLKKARPLSESERLELDRNKKLKKNEINYFRGWRPSWKVNFN